MAETTNAGATLTGKLRQGVGKGPSRRLRAEGLIPAVLYGPHSKEPMQFSVDPLALKKAIQTPLKFNTVLTLKLEGQADRIALVREVQVDPVERDVLHADFFEVRAEEKVLVNVPVIIIGRAAGAADGGILNQVTRELRLSVLPKDIPEKIEVDVSALKIGDSIHVSDLKFGAGVTAKTKGEITIAVCAAPEREEVVVAATPVAGAAPAAGAEGAAAAGAAPAAGAAAAGDKKAAGGDKKAEPAKKDAKK